MSWPVQEKVCIDTHIIQSIQEREDYISQGKFLNHLGSTEQEEKVGYSYCTDVHAPIVPLRAPLVHQVVLEYVILSAVSCLSLDKLIEEKVGVTEMEQEECLVQKITSVLVNIMIVFGNLLIDLTGSLQQGCSSVTYYRLRPFLKSNFFQKQLQSLPSVVS